MMDKVKHKSCIVQTCNNTTDNAPDLIFFEVPVMTQKDIIDKWRKATGVPFALDTVLYCCQEHFDLHNDTSNYMEWYISGDEEGQNKIPLTLKDESVPHRLLCPYPGEEPELETVNNNELNKSKNPSDVEETVGSINDTSEVIKPIPLKSKYKAVPLRFQPQYRIEEVKTVNINELNKSENDLNVEETSQLINDTSEVNKTKVCANTQFESRNVDSKIAEVKARLFSIRNRRLIALCKPLKIELSDLKNTVNPKINNLLATDSTIKKTDPSLYTFAYIRKRKRDEITEMVLKKRRRLIPKIIKWERDQSHCITIHDLQCKEIDIYYLNSDLDITTYKRLTDVSQASADVQYPYKAEFKGSKVRLRVQQCCCWFSREKFIELLLAKYLRRSIEFTKKPHRCSGNICTCCCRDMPLVNSYVQLPSIKQTANVWLKKTTEYHKSLASKQDLEFSAIVKALIDTPKVHNERISENRTKNASIKIKLNNEYYQISNGQIEFYRKTEDYSQFSNVLADITRNVCCWYAREKLCDKLLNERVKPSAAKFIRTAHLCPVTACKCCCKPKQSKKAHLSQTCMLVRYTTNIGIKSIKTIIVFSSSATKAIPESNEMFLQKNTSTKTVQELISKNNMPKSISQPFVGQRTPASITVHKPISLCGDSMAQKVPSSPESISNNYIVKPISQPFVGQRTPASNTVHRPISLCNDLMAPQNVPSSPESISNNYIPKPISQPFVSQTTLAFNTVHRPISSRSDLLAPQKVPRNIPNVTMSNTLNTNFIPRSAVSLPGVQSSNVTVQSNDVLNTMQKLIIPVVTSNFTTTYTPPTLIPSTNVQISSITKSGIFEENNLQNIASTTIGQLTDMAVGKMLVSDGTKLNITLAPNTCKPHKCRSKNPSNCRCGLWPTQSVSKSNLTKKPSSITYIKYKNETGSSQFTHSAKKVPRAVTDDLITESVVSEVDLLGSLWDGKTQESNRPSINTFIHNTKRVPSSAVTNNFTAIARSSRALASSTFLPENVASTSCMPDTPKTTTDDIKLDTVKKVSNERLQNTERNSTAVILQKIKNIGFMYRPGNKVTTQLETPIKDMSTAELEILNSALVMLEHQIKAAGLEKDGLYFKLNSNSNNEELAPNNNSFAQNPSELNTHLGSLMSLKQTRYIESYNAFMKKRFENKSLSNYPTKIQQNIVCSRRSNSKNTKQE